MKKAVITGITGQDGSYLAEFLIEKGYEVHGIKRRTSLINTQRVDHLFEDDKYRDVFHLHHGDMTDTSSLTSILAKVQPDEIYNYYLREKPRITEHIIKREQMHGIGTPEDLEHYLNKLG